MPETIEDDFCTHMLLDELLWHCFTQNYHLDHSNAAIHCATVRFSPLTFRLAEELWLSYPNYKINERLEEVMHDRGLYAEDTGR